MTTPVFPRPTLPNLIQRVTQQITAALPGTDPLLRRAVSVVIATALSRELINEYAYLDNLAQWFFVATTSGIYLDYKGNPVGVFRTQAAAAAGNVTFSGVAGTIIPQGTVLTSQDGSQSYATAVSLTIASGGTVTGAIVSQTGGVASNQVVGTTLTLSVAVAGVTAQAVVASGGLTGGQDLETDDLFRVRVLARLQQPPQGGAARDYVTWAKLVAGVTRVWVYPLNRGAGTVDYAFVLDGRAPGSILPLSADVTAVQASIAPNLPADMPTNGCENITLTPDNIAVTIANFVAETGFTLAQCTANITASLQGLFASTTPGGATFGDGIAPGGTGGKLPLEQISDAIAQSAGTASFDLSAPTSDIASASGHIAQLGAVTITT